jgi:hypothetical protein
LRVFEYAGEVELRCVEGVEVDAARGNVHFVAARGSGDDACGLGGGEEEGEEEFEEEGVADVVCAELEFMGLGG